MEDSQVSDMGGSSDNNAAPRKEAEKLFTRDELAKIVAHQSSQAAENAKREAEAKYQRDLESAIQAKQQQRNAEIPRDVDTDAIYQRIQERFNQDMREQHEKHQLEAHRAEMTRAADSYHSKIAQGKTAYQDFDEVTKDFDPAAFPQLMYLVAGMENAADIVYDLSNNPLKLAGLDRLAEKNPRQAQAALVSLAQSISTNKQAHSDAQSQNIAEPLDRLQPSRVSGSNGKMSVKDLQNQPWLRG